MNILFTYIRKYLQFNKISTFISILSLTIATAFFYIVVCLGINTTVGLNDMIVNSYGNYHTVFSDVDDSFIRSLYLHEQIKQVNIVEYQKQIYMDCFQSDDKDSFYLLGIDSSSFNDLGLSMIEGRFPLNSNEILITNSTLDDSKIRLDIDKLITLEDKEYKIVGIATNTNFDENKSFHSILTVKDNISKKYAFVEYKNRHNSLDVSKQISNDFVGHFDSYEMNQNYLILPTNQMNHVFLFFALFVVVLGISFFAMNIFLIRNCYKNSYSNREKHLAILKTVGVTQLQCKTMILYEGLLLLGVSLSVGLFIGSFLYEVLRKILNHLFFSVSVRFFTIGNQYSLHVLFLTILYVVVFSLFFIRQSSKKILAQSVSFTLQSTEEVEIMDNPYLQLEKKQSIFMRLLKKNIKQNKCSYNQFILGIIGIATLFILVNGYMGYLREGIFFETNDHNYDVEAIVQNDYYPTQLMTRFKNTEFASSVVISEKLVLYGKDFTILDDDYKDVTLIRDAMQFEIITYSDDIIQNFISSQNFYPLKELDSSSGILINQTYNSAHRRFYNILKDDRVGTLYDGDQSIEIDLQLITTNSLITGTGYEKYPQIIVTRDKFNEIMNKLEEKQHKYHIYFQSNDSTSLVRELNTLNDGTLIDFDIINTQISIKNGRVFISLIRIIIYGYILLLAIMAGLSISCITSVNFDYRKREFVLYRVLGLRMRDMMRLIFMELLYYTGKVFTCSWVLSQCLNYISYQLFFKNLGLHFYVPENSIIGSILLVILFLIGSMCYIYIRMRTLKYSLVLKNEISLM